MFDNLLTIWIKKKYTIIQDLNKVILLEINEY